MYKQILIPVALDHETLIARKLDIARHLLAEDGQITLLTVLESIPGFVSEFVDLKIDNHLTQKVAEKLRAAVGEDQHDLFLVGPTDADLARAIEAGLDAGTGIEGAVSRNRSFRHRLKRSSARAGAGLELARAEEGVEEAAEDSARPRG